MPFKVSLITKTEQTLFVGSVKCQKPGFFFSLVLVLYLPTVVPVRLSPRSSRSDDFGDISETNGPGHTLFAPDRVTLKRLASAKYCGLGTRQYLSLVDKIDQPASFPKLPF